MRSAPRRIQFCRSPNDGTAAVDDEDLAGDEIGLREIGDRAGDVFRAAGARQRGAADEIFSDSGGVVGKRNCAGSDGVDANLGARARERQRVSMMTPAFDVQ